MGENDVRARVPGHAFEVTAVVDREVVDQVVGPDVSVAVGLAVVEGIDQGPDVVVVDVVVRLEPIANEPTSMFRKVMSLAPRSASKRPSGGVEALDPCRSVERKPCIRPAVERDVRGPALSMQLWPFNHRAVLRVNGVAANRHRLERAGMKTTSLWEVLDESACDVLLRVGAPAGDLDHIARLGDTISPVEALARRRPSTRLRIRAAARDEPFRGGKRRDEHLFDRLPSGR